MSYWGPFESRAARLRCDGVIDEALVFHDVESDADSQADHAEFIKESCDALHVRLLPLPLSYSSES